MKFLLILLLFNQISFAQECEEPGVVSQFTAWVSSFMKKAAPPHLCPDVTLGRVARDQSLGGKYLKAIANEAWFDKALQRDPQIKAFLNSDPRLKKSQARDKNLQACVSQGPTLKYLLGLDSGVSENLDIGEHTATVLNTYLQQRKFYAEIDLKGVTSKTMDQFMLPILALHDIGKGIAVKAGDKELQHHYTSKFVKTYLRSIRFTDKEINVAIALIDHDSVGEFLRPGGISSQEARGHLQSRAKLANMKYGNFIKLQKLFYTADAASYPFLREKVFQKSKSGKLEIKSSKFQQLL